MSEEGTATLPYLAAVGLSLLLMTLFANVIVAGYARGALRVALDDAVRAGARTGSAALAVTACTRAASTATDDLLGGAIGRTITIACTVEGDHVVATADGVVAGWLPSSADLPLAVRASSRLELTG